MKAKLLDVCWSPYTMEQLHEIFTNVINKNGNLLVSSLNLHSLYLSNKNDFISKTLKNSIIHIDGTPILWLLRLYGIKLNSAYRITWVDWMKPFLELAAESNWKIFYLGASPGVAEAGFADLSSTIPNLVYKVHHGYFSMSSTDSTHIAVMDSINTFSPNILVVGMGMGRQEEWIQNNIGALNSNIIITSGAAIEYFAGVVSVPPRWSGNYGLEWLFRLLDNPRRFWFRYTIEPIYVLIMIIKDFSKKIT